MKTTLSRKEFKRERSQKTPVDSVVILRYSLEIPSIPGWYWYKDHHGVERVEQVHEHPRMPGVMTVLENSFMGWRHVSIKNMRREWAGPLAKPEAR